jgi:hypothetical protein
MPHTKSHIEYIGGSRIRFINIHCEKIGQTFHDELFDRPLCLVEVGKTMGLVKHILCRCGLPSDVSAVGENPWTDSRKGVP